MYVFRLKSIAIHLFMYSTAMYSINRLKFLFVGREFWNISYTFVTCRIAKEPKQTDVDANRPSRY